MHFLGGIDVFDAQLRAVIVAVGPMPLTNEVLSQFDGFDSELLQSIRA
jgi:hypothetical protein